jgi:AcrR family transcriptional regulator
MARASRKRDYDNSLREERAKETRARILQALVQLTGEGAQDLSVGRVAALAGVSEPTVYRYFPNRDAMFEGVDEWLASRASAAPFPETLEELATTPLRTYPFYLDNEQLIRAARTRELAAEAARGPRQRRTKRLAELLRPAVDHLSPEDAEIATMLIRYLVGSHAWHALTDELGLTTEQAARGCTWATETLLAALREQRLHSRRRPVPLRTETTTSKDKG